MLRITPDRKHYDFRFDYRKALLPAASQPVIAGMLAYLAGPLPQGARILDPFCGSGMELIECGLRYPGMQLMAGDLEAEAMEACRINFEAAGLRAAKLETIAFEQWNLSDLDLIITNPPFGRRTQVDDIGELLDLFIGKLTTWLRPGGRLVWVNPQPKRTRAMLQKQGLHLDQCYPINMGGMRLEAQLVIFGEPGKSS